MNINITLEEFEQVKNLHEQLKKLPENILEKYDDFLIYRKSLEEEFKIENLEKKPLEKQFESFLKHFKFLSRVEEEIRKQEKKRETNNSEKYPEEWRVKNYEYKNIHTGENISKKENINLSEEIDKELELNSSLKTALRKVNGLTHK